MQEKQGKGLYFGWWVVVSCFLLMGLVYAPCTTLMGQFVVPLSTHFEVPRTVATLVITVGMFATMIASPFAGKLLSKHGVRGLVAVMTVISAGSNVGIALSNSFVLLCAFAAVRGIALAFLSMVPISIMVNSWFGQKAKGKAMAFATVGSGIGTMIVSPFLAVIIENYSWRQGFMIFAAMSIVCLPLVLITFSPSPQAKGLARLGDDPDAAAQTGGELRGLTGGEALKTPMFWAMLLGFLLVSGICQSWVTNAPGFYGGLGIESVRVGTLISVTALMLTVGKILLGFLCDRFGAKAGFAVSVSFAVLCYCIGVVAELGTITSLAIACAITMGLGQASLNITAPLVVGDLCGNKDFGVCIGYNQTAQALGSSLVPIIITVFYDVTGNYVGTFATGAVLSFGAIVLITAAYQIHVRRFATA